MGVYPQHEHLITQVVPGEIIVIDKGQAKSLAVGEGLVEITASRVEIVTNMADCRRAHRRGQGRRGPRARRCAAAREAVRRRDRVHQRVARAVAGAAERQAPPERVIVTAAAARWSRVGALVLAGGCRGLVGRRRRRRPRRRPVRSSPPKPSDPLPSLISGEAIIWMPTGAGQYTPAVRAAGIAAAPRRGDRGSLDPDPTVTVTEVEGSSEVRVGPRLLMVVTARDASAPGRRAGHAGAACRAGVRDGDPQRASAARARRPDALRCLRAGRHGRVRDPGVGDRAIDAMVPAARRTLASRASRRGAPAGCGDRVVGSNRRRHRSRVPAASVCS